MKDLFVKNGNTLRAASREEIINSAARYLTDEVTGEKITMDNAADLFRRAIGGHDREHVIVAFVDVHSRVLSMETMFQGTVDQAPIYQREIARRALALNAAGVLVAHNHPSSGKAEPSENDVQATLKLANALNTVDVRMLAAYVVTPTDFATIDPPEPREPRDLIRRLFGDFA